MGLGIQQLMIRTDSFNVFLFQDSQMFRSFNVQCPIKSTLDAVCACFAKLIMMYSTPFVLPVCGLVMPLRKSSSPCWSQREEAGRKFK